MTNETKSSIFDKPLDMIYNEPAAQTNWESFMAVVRSRRSIRVFKSDLIPEQDMRDCLNAAVLAPNSSNLQPWEFYWVRNSEKRKALVKACFSQPAASTASELVVAVARIDTWQRHRHEMITQLLETPNPPKAVLDYYRKLVPLAYTQGPFGSVGFLKHLLFSVAGLFQPVPREPSSIGELRTWAIKSTALGCENLMLALRAKGFDSCPMEGMDSKRVRKILGLGRKASIVMVIGAGRRDSSKVYGPQVRFDHAIFEV